MTIIPLTENENKQLIGGFSIAISPSEFEMNNVLSNNCNSGNCTPKCNNKMKKAKGTNSNCKGNCVKGCGNKL